MLPSMLKVMGATVLFALVHSSLASREAKNSAARLFGERQRNGLYRVFYLLQSVFTLAILWAYFSRLPDRVLYRVSGKSAILLRLVQMSGLAYATSAAYLVGLKRILGLESLVAWLKREPEVPPEPEAQGPSLDAQGNLKVAGVFRWSRHPLNFAPLPIFWFNPTMTARLAAFNLVTTIYLVIGSFHEELRLRNAYGSPYEDYQNSSVSFYLPTPTGKMRLYPQDEGA